MSKSATQAPLVDRPVKLRVADEVAVLAEAVLLLDTLDGDMDNANREQRINRAIEHIQRVMRSLLSTTTPDAEVLRIVQETYKPGFSGLNRADQQRIDDWNNAVASIERRLPGSTGSTKHAG